MFAKHAHGELVPEPSAMLESAVPEDVSQETLQELLDQAYAKSVEETQQVWGAQGSEEVQEARFEKPYQERWGEEALEQPQETGEAYQELWGASEEQTQKPEQSYEDKWDASNVEETQGLEESFQQAQGREEPQVFAESRFEQDNYEVTPPEGRAQEAPTDLVGEGSRFGVHIERSQFAVQVWLCTCMHVCACVHVDV
jgi:hypothetical protein